MRCQDERPIENEPEELSTAPNIKNLRTFNRA